MRTLPPWPLARSVILTALVVWIVPRGILTGGAQVAASITGGSPEISHTILLLLNLAVAGIVYLDLKIAKERVFAANLGVSPLSILALASFTALLGELFWSGIPALLASVVGG